MDSTKWLPKFCHVLSRQITSCGKRNLVLVLVEYSQRIITRNEFKTFYKLATAFQVSNADFLVLSSKYVCKAVSGCTKVPSSKFISNVVAKSLRKFACVRKFVSVPMFAQSVRSPSYRVVKRCYLDLVNKVNINTRRSVSVCRKVGKPALVKCLYQRLPYFST